MLFIDITNRTCLANSVQPSVAPDGNVGARDIVRYGGRYEYDRNTQLRMLRSSVFQFYDALKSLKSQSRVWINMTRGRGLMYFASNLPGPRQTIISNWSFFDTMTHVSNIKTSKLSRA